LRAGVDFIHFFFVFFTIFLSYVVSGMLLFGRRLWNWSNINLAFNEAFLLAMGDGDYDEMTAEYPVTAGLWYWTFIWLVMVLMLNMLMAIVFDVFSEVKADASGTDPIWTQLINIAYEYYMIMMGQTVPVGEILASLAEAPETDFVVKTLMQRVGPGLGEEQATALISDARDLGEERAQAAVRMSDALRILGTLKLKVQGIESNLEKVAMAEEKEKAQMERKISENEPGTSKPEPPPEARLEDTAQKIDVVEIRMDRIECFLQESSNFGSSRQKDLKNRLQTIEDILRTQRNAVTRSTADIWSQPPPKMHEPEFHMI
jgi:hypothetical protein